MVKTEECTPCSKMGKNPNHQVTQNSISSLESPSPLAVQVRDLRPERTILITSSNPLHNKPANCDQDYRLHNLKDIQSSFMRAKLLLINLYH